MVPGVHSKKGDLRLVGPEPILALDLEEPNRRQWRAVGLFLLLALFLHLVLLLVKVDWSSLTAPPRVEVQTISPDQLNKVRKSWKSKQFILDNGQPKTEEAPPPNARFQSKENRTVEKEQKSKFTAPIPNHARPRPEIRKHEKTESKRIPKLGNLGVPLNLTAKDPPEEKPATRPGDAYVDDKKMSEGSENLLNTEQAVYYSFYARLAEAINPNWEARMRDLLTRKHFAAGEYVSIVEIVLDREGNLVKLNWIQTSGNSDADDVVNTTFQKLARFPNPPTGLLDENGLVHFGWKFTLTLSEAAGVTIAPPERIY